jgi:hypothetical protein
MIINILDPGLSIVGGHHLEWDRLVAAELVRQGHVVTVYCHASITPEARSKFSEPIKLVPLFKNYAYFNSRQLDPIAGELLGFFDIAAVLAEELQFVASADLWLWPSLFQAQLYACTLVRPRAAVSGCIHTEPDFMCSQGAIYWRYAAIKAKQTGLRIQIGAPGPILQQQYDELFGIDRFVKLLPLPNQSCSPSSPRENLRKIGFFGHQRQDKGTQLIPALISILLHDGYQVILHDSGNVFGAEQIPGLTRIGYVPDLASEIKNCDLIVLPYDAHAYRSKESAIVWDAFATGIPVVVPNGTAPALRVLTSGAGKVFHFPTVDSIYRAISEAKDDYYQIALAAYRASQDWANIHGVEKLSLALIGD